MVQPKATLAQSVPGLPPRFPDQGCNMTGLNITIPHPPFPEIHGFRAQALDEVLVKLLAAQQRLHLSSSSPRIRLWKPEGPVLNVLGFSVM